MKILKTKRFYLDNILKNKVYLYEIFESLNKIMNENFLKSKEKFNNLNYLLKRIIINLIENEKKKK